MASTKDIYEADVYAAGIFAAGVWRGSGIVSRTILSGRLGVVPSYTATPVVEPSHETAGVNIYPA